MYPDSVFLKNKIAGLGRGVIMRLNALRALTHIHTAPLCVDRLCDRTQPGVIPSGSSWQHVIKTIKMAQSPSLISVQSAAPWLFQRITNEGDRPPQRRSSASPCITLTQTKTTPPPLLTIALPYLTLCLQGVPPGVGDRLALPYLVVM